MTASSLNLPNKFEDGYISGLNLSYSTTSSLIVGAGSFLDSRKKNNFSISDALTIDCTVVGANGIDTGSLENNKWYAVYAIGSPMRQVPVAGLVSLSASNPIVPPPYESIRLIGWMRTNGSAQFIRHVQYGAGNLRRYFWRVENNVSIVLNAGGSTTYAAVTDLANLMPPSSRIVNLLSEYIPQADGNRFYLRPTQSGLTESMSFYAPLADKKVSHYLEMETDENQSIDYHVSHADDNLFLWALGFTDFI